MKHYDYRVLYTRIQVEKFGTVLPPQNWGSTYMRVTLSAYVPQIFP